MLDDHVVVRGSARRDVAPDVAVLRALVVEVDSDRREAFARCGARVERIVPKLRAAVDGEGNVSTGEVSLDRHYEPSVEEGAPRFAASCVVAAECAPARAADVIAIAVEDGIDRLAGPEYSLRDRAPLVEQLLGEAVDAARRKAQHLAQAARRSLGAVVAIDEAGRGPSELFGIEVAGDADELRAGPSGSRLEMQPAQVSVAVSVRVTFALADTAGESFAPAAVA